MRGDLSNANRLTIKQFCGILCFNWHENAKIRGNILGLDKKRVLHSLGVAKKMKNLANELFPENDEFANDMFILGLLHDVGYELTTAQEEHADVAGNALKINGYKYWKEVYFHGKSDAKFESEALRILNIADLLTDVNGNPTTVQDRLSDVKERYGENSFAYKDFQKLANKLGLL